jgi:hypothetical protein
VSRPRRPATSPVDRWLGRAIVVLAVTAVGCFVVAVAWAVLT